jgi:hypothetical protein
MPTQTSRRNPYGYAPKPGTNGRLPFVSKLSLLDKQHMRQWYAMGFNIASIANAYDVSYGYASAIVRGQKRK